jgi:hypothetical protein
MDESLRFRINSPQVTHETIDGEVVIINLETGSYFSMTGSGAAMWALLGAGASATEVVAELSGQFAAPAQEIRDSVDTIVATLQAEHLIVPDASRQARVESTAYANGNGPFVAPTLQKYTDMQDLLLLDPIHDTADEGWPHKD